MKDTQTFLKNIVNGLTKEKFGNYLHSTGWLKSALTDSSIDVEGNPIPWISYPALHFLQSRIQADWDIFEYGSGASTLWWAKHVNSVTACEHDPKWANWLKTRTSENVQLILKEDFETDSYARTCTDTGKQYDIITIDGMDRTRCVQHALRAINDTGVILCDDAEWDHNSAIYEQILEYGFKKIDFQGMGPLKTYPVTTSFYYRKDNCLGI